MSTCLLPMFEDQLRRSSVGMRDPGCRCHNGMSFHVYGLKGCLKLALLSSLFVLLNRKSPEVAVTKSMNISCRRNSEHQKMDTFRITSQKLTSMMILPLGMLRMCIVCGVSPAAVRQEWLPAALNLIQWGRAQYRISSDNRAPREGPCDQ